MTTQLGLRLNGWHEQRLMELAKEALLPHNTVAKDLLMAALEQASKDPPPRVGAAHLKKFHEGRKS